MLRSFALMIPVPAVLDERAPPANPCVFEPPHLPAGRFEQVARGTIGSDRDK